MSSPFLQLLQQRARSSLAMLHGHHVLSEEPLAFAILNSTSIPKLAVRDGVSCASPPKPTVPSPTALLAWNHRPGSSISQGWSCTGNIPPPKIPKHPAARASLLLHFNIHLLEVMRKTQAFAAAGTWLSCSPLFAVSGSNEPGVTLSPLPPPRGATTAGSQAGGNCCSLWVASASVLAAD